MSKKTFSSISIFMTFAFLLTVAACDPAEKKEREEEEAIESYLASNSNLQFERKESGLYFLEVEAGTGPQVTTGDTAYVKYTGKLLDGTVFDTNVGKTDTLKFAVNEGYVLQGFDEGVMYMSEGGKAMFLIPSNLAYGSTGYYFPSYTPVLFDVELVKLVPGVR
jgi:peptidyl-prolyl cis-trans isomerase A (cyclophilin A)